MTGRFAATGPWPTPAAALTDAGLQSVLARACEENFPVVTRLLPLRYRRHVAAVYAFARLVDDISDEAAAPARAGLLDSLETDFDRMLAGAPQLPVMCTLSSTISACRLPVEPFRRLIYAGRQDQNVTRYATFDDLLDYCALAADPIGHILLHIFGAATPQRLRIGESLSRALQLIDIVQDVKQDFQNGRIYLPQDDLVRFDCGEEDLIAPVAGARVRRLIAFETRRAGRLLDEGAQIVHSLRGFARLATAGYVAGGRATIAAINAADYDVLAQRPAAPTSRLLGHLLGTLLTKRMP
jgi:squalene synthase HpnC